MPLPRLRVARSAMALEASGLGTTEALVTTAPEPAPRESTFDPEKRTLGLTPVELARELGKSPKTIRQALRDRYGKLPFTGDRWGASAPSKKPTSANDSAELARALRPRKSCHPACPPYSP
jgi:hypothetical protein